MTRPTTTEIQAGRLERLTFSVEEVAGQLGVCSAFLRLEIRRGRLRPTRLGRRIVISTAEIDRYIRAGTETVTLSTLLKE
jgi:excisionase family DNA binding protein